MKTFGDFLKAAKLEKAAGNEAFDDDARLPLDEKLRLGNAAGPLVCASCTKDEATFSPHPSISFDWGKLKPGGSVHPVRPGEVLQLHAKLPKGTLSPDDTPTTLKKGYFRDPNFNLSTGTTYLFEEAHFDGVRQVIEILGACEPADPWPAGLPAQPILTAPDGAPAEERALAACLDDRNPLFAVKGPPGTGKTDLLAELALKLAQAGKKVGIITVSHDAVNNALARAAAKLGTGPSTLTLHKHGKDDHGIAGVAGGKLGETELPAIWGGVIAAASQMFEKDGNDLVLAFKYGTCDVLLLDEAGQIPAYEAAALSHLATRMILFGDEDQLPNITKAAHPPGSHGDSSAMEYLRKVLGPEWTIPLETSHRMNTDICGLIQRHFYPDIPLKAGKNAGAHLLENHVPFPSLVQDAFRHKNPRLSRSSEEVVRVVAWVKRLLQMQVVLENEDPHPMTTHDIAILTPFRTQAGAITRAIYEAGIADADQLRIGTVDKMQGQGAAAVIYSMASSSPDYIANQAEWLFSSNRWNVAISRAHACAIVVGDVEAHLDAMPKTLNGIAAQGKIRKLIGDVWTNMAAGSSPIQAPPAVASITAGSEGMQPAPQASVAQAETSKLASLFQPAAQPAPTTASEPNMMELSNGNCLVAEIRRTPRGIPYLALREGFRERTGEIVFTSLLPYPARHLSKLIEMVATFYSAYLPSRSKIKLGDLPTEEQWHQHCNGQKQCYGAYHKRVNNLSEMVLAHKDANMTPAMRKIPIAKRDFREFRDFIQTQQNRFKSQTQQG